MIANTRHIYTLILFSKGNEVESVVYVYYFVLSIDRSLHPETCATGSA